MGRVEGTERQDELNKGQVNQRRRRLGEDARWAEFGPRHEDDKGGIGRREMGWRRGFI